jgi:transcriptional regulator with XRE-family HTH domain
MTETEWLNIFGDNLRDLMLDANMTQRELADDTDLSESAISQYLNKRRVPTVRAIINIAYSLDCSVEELIDFGDRVW